MSELPANWAAIRQRILTRDGHRCTAILANGRRCHDKATDVHHIGDHQNHADGNLVAICAWHHRRETSREGHQARWQHTEKRAPEQHPGLR